MRENESGKILLAAGSIAITDTVIPIKDPQVAGVTVDATNKTVSVIAAKAGAEFTVGGLDADKFANGVPMYAALTYSVTDKGAGKLVQAIDSSTGKVTLGRPGAKTDSDIEVKVSGAAQKPYAALPEATLYTVPKDSFIASGTFTTTVTGTVQDQTTKAELSGVTVSALKRTAVSGPDGKFSLQVQHSGKFKLALKRTCYAPLTTPDITAKGSHNAGAIGLTAKPEPTGAARYTFTPKGPAADKKFTLTVNCVREIANDEFNSFIDGGIMSRKAIAEGISGNARIMVTEISLPRTLIKIGDRGLLAHNLLSTLTIPNNVETIGSNALTSSGISAKSGAMIFFESNSRLKAIGNSAFESSTLGDFLLPKNLETIGKQAFRLTKFKFGPTVPNILIIPAKVAKIEDQAFAALGPQGLGLTAVEILSEELAKPAGGPFPLGDNLFQNIIGITEIKLPQAVFDSYTAAERTTIFGSIPLKPR